jgi:hypothetical protein
MLEVAELGITECRPRLFHPGRFLYPLTFLTKDDIITIMGLYPMLCPSCNQPHLWWSGNLDQLRHVCVMKAADKHARDLIKRIKKNLEEVVRPKKKRGKKK